MKHVTSLSALSLMAVRIKFGIVPTLIEFACKCTLALVHAHCILAFMSNCAGVWELSHWAVVKIVRGAAVAVRQYMSLHSIVSVCVSIRMHLASTNEIKVLAWWT